MRTSSWDLAYVLFLVITQMVLLFFPMFVQLSMQQMFIFYVIIMFVSEEKGEVRQNNKKEIEIIDLKHEINQLKINHEFQVQDLKNQLKEKTK